QQAQVARVLGDGGSAAVGGGGVGGGGQNLLAGGRQKLPLPGGGGAAGEFPPGRLPARGGVSRAGAGGRAGGGAGDGDRRGQACGGVPLPMSHRVSSNVAGRLRPRPGARTNERRLTNPDPLLGLPVLS